MHHLATTCTHCQQTSFLRQCGLLADMHTETGLMLIRLFANTPVSLQAR